MNQSIGGGIAGGMNLNEVLSRMGHMSPQQLQQVATMHSDDPLIVSTAKYYADAYKKQQAGAQPQQGAQPPVNQQAIAEMAPPVAQGLPENSGIGALPAPNMQKMAGGGIVAFDDGGEVEEPVQMFAGGGLGRGDAGEGRTQYQQYALANAEKYGLDPDFVDHLFYQESKYKPDAVSSAGARGIGQMEGPAASDMGLAKEDMHDPYKNMDASMRYMQTLSKQFGGDLTKVAAAYNMGPTALSRHLAKNNGAINFATLPKETRDYIPKVVGSDIDTTGANPRPLPAPAKAFANPTDAQLEDPEYKAALQEESARRNGPPQIPGEYAQGKDPRTPEQAALAAMDWSRRSDEAYKAGRNTFETIGDKLGISDQAQRDISNTLNALPMGGPAMRMPGLAAKTPGMLSGLAALGERAYKAVGGGKAEQAGLAALKESQAARAAQLAEAARPAQLAEEASMSGALPEELRTITQSPAKAAAAAKAVQAAKAEEAARLANTPSPALRAQQASYGREAENAARMMQAARIAQNAGTGAAAANMASRASGSSPVPGIAGLPAGTPGAGVGPEAPQDYQSGPHPSGRTPADFTSASDAAPEDMSPQEKASKGFSLSNRDLFMMGMAGLQSKSPHFLGTIGDMLPGYEASQKAGAAESRAALEQQQGDLYASQSKLAEERTRHPERFLRESTNTPERMALEVEKLVSRDMGAWDKANPLNATEQDPAMNPKRRQYEALMRAQHSAAVGLTDDTMPKVAPAAADNPLWGKPVPVNR